MRGRISEARSTARQEALPKEETKRKQNGKARGNVFQRVSSMMRISSSVQVNEKKAENSESCPRPTLENFQHRAVGQASFDSDDGDILANEDDRVIITAKLHFAASRDMPSTMQHIVERQGEGLRSDRWRTEEGRTLLHTAASKNSAKLLKALLEQHGLDPNAVDLAGFTPLDAARGASAKEAEEILIAAEASPGWSETEAQSKDLANPIPRVEPEAVEVGEVLGEGAFGMVRSGKWHGAEIAIKSLKESYSRDQIAKKELSREMAAWSRASHPHICRLFGKAQSPSLGVTLILESVTNGSLSSMMSRINEQGILPETGRVCRLMRQLASALSFLHGRKPVAIIHRDIKPANCLITAADELKLADFGLARLLDSHETPVDDAQFALTGETGAFRYMAPENFLNEQYSVKADVFSLAIVAFELLEGRATLEDGSMTISDGYEFAKRVAGASGKPCRPVFAVAQGSTKRERILRETIQACWAHNPKERMSAWDAVQRFASAATTDPAAIDGDAHSSQARSQCCTVQ